MCSNYQAPVQLHLNYEALAATFEYRTDMYPGYFGPILLPHDGDPTELVPVRAMFGMVPHWAKDTKLSRQTYNARSETVGQKPSFRDAWKKQRFCLIPVQAFYEPNYESGKPVRWAIKRKDDKPFALTGIYETCKPKPGQDDVGDTLRSFSMLTISGEGHPIMQRFHAPEDEKRSVVLLRPEDYAGWLSARNDAEAREFLQPIDPDEYMAEAAPKPLRIKTGPVPPERETVEQQKEKPPTLTEQKK